MRGGGKRLGLGRLAAALLIVSGVGPAFVPAPAGAAGGQSSSPFAPGVPQTPQTIPAQPAPVVPLNNTSGSSSSGLSPGSSIAIGVGALVIIGGIAFFIWYDARRRAPVRAAAAAERSLPGSKRKAKPRKLSAAERRRRKRGRAR